MKGMIRFSLRDLLWLVVLASVVAAWYADHRRLNELIRLQKAASIQAAIQLQTEWLKRYRGEIP
jgi:hypothetical protein